MSYWAEGENIRDLRGGGWTTNWEYLGEPHRTRLRALSERLPVLLDHVFQLRDSQDLRFEVIESSELRERFPVRLPLSLPPAGFLCLVWYPTR